VVSGAHTASGKPLLANDMHLGLTEPNIWYMADLKAPGYHAAGVTLPGMPLVIEGHNEHVAWGITALMGDVQDLYIEKLDGKGNFERNDESWTPLRVDHETIKVRGGRDVKLDVEFTDHGPLLNPILPKEKRGIALKWTIYDPQLNTMPVYRVNTAANWQEFSAALADWCWPTLNIVYADDQGHIAYHAVGRIPIRNSEYRGGSYPLPFDPMNLREEWKGFSPVGPSSSVAYIPFDDMPKAVDPPSGFLATANARVTTEKTKYPITSEWIEPYRVERIYKSLEGRNGLTPKDMLAVQTDVYSEVDQELGQRIAYAIDHADGGATDARLKQAADLLRNWDGRLTTDSVAASIVTQTRKALWPLILEPKLGKDWTEYRWMESNFAEEEIVMHAKPVWLPKAYKNWDELLTAAVRKGMNDGKAPSDLTKWAYGSWHVVDIEHPLGGFLPFVGRVAGTGTQPQSGDTTTVKQVGRAFGPSQRFTMDWSSVDSSTQNIVLGQSGNPYSGYFRDQWNDWYGGTTFALPFTSDAVAAQTRHTLRLRP
jgi:penicillin amidase